MSISLRQAVAQWWRSPVACGAMLAVGASLSVAQAQESKPQFLGVATCVACHNQTLQAGNPSSLSALAQNRELCALDEVKTFETTDKHIKAFELLKGDLGQRMEKLLGYKVTEDKRCLACHSNWHWKEGFEKPEHFEFGVTCESCHGAASKWKDPHDKVDWRKVKPDVKEKEAGFIDVRNPVRRARQCFSCHIGNVTEGKVVTHEMYAAGHPPLPSIEIETFVSQMPFHWRTLRERGEFANQKEYLAANFPDQKDPTLDLARTKSTLIGGVMALRESLNLFGEQAVDKHETSVWPELAVFDCAACHHDLRSKSWRRDRGYGASIPGRPQFYSWPTALVKVAVRHRAGDDDAKFKAQWDEFHTNLEKLRRVLDKQPFGAPQDIRSITHGADGKGGLVAWLDNLAEEIFKSPVREADAKRALKAVVALDAKDYPDFHSARQTLWVFRTIQSELQVAYPTFKPRATGETTKQSQERALQNLVMFREWEQGPKLDSFRKTDDLLAKHEFASRLRLKLPAGVEYVIAAQLPDALDAAADYDPEWFRTQLAKLEKELPKD